MILEEQFGAHSWHTQFKFMVTLGSFFMYHASGFLGTWLIAEGIEIVFYQIS